MNAISSPRAYMRSLATRDSDRALSAHVQEAIDICKAAGYDLIILESAGVGQSDASILDYSDLSLYVMTPEYGAASQLEKINMLDYADLVVLNKFDKAGALDALHDIENNTSAITASGMPKTATCLLSAPSPRSSMMPGINELFGKLIATIEKKTGIRWGPWKRIPISAIPPPNR
jgi:methylmalonyl-CoA mutase